jgi:hypothetical protein
MSLSIKFTGFRPVPLISGIAGQHSLENFSSDERLRHASPNIRALCKEVVLIGKAVNIARPHSTAVRRRRAVRFRQCHCNLNQKVFVATSIACNTAQKPALPRATVKLGRSTGERHHHSSSRVGCGGAKKLAGRSGARSLLRRSIGSLCLAVLRRLSVRGCCVRQEPLRDLLVPKWTDSFYEVHALLELCVTRWH